MHQEEDSFYRAIWRSSSGTYWRNRFLSFAFQFCADFGLCHLRLTIRHEDRTRKIFSEFRFKCSSLKQNSEPVWSLESLPATTNFCNVCAWAAQPEQYFVDLPPKIAKRLRVPCRFMA